MNIGEEKRTIIVTPIESPVPERIPARKADPIPQRPSRKQPVKPATPRRTPTKVPA